MSKRFEKSDLEHPVTSKKLGKDEVLACEFRRFAGANPNWKRLMNMTGLTQAELERLYDGNWSTEESRYIIQRMMYVEMSRYSKETFSRSVKRFEHILSLLD